MDVERTKEVTRKMIESWIKKEENFFLQNRTPLRVLELYQIEKVIS